MLRIPSDALVITVGAPASGKSTWASRWFRDEQVVSSDALRGVVGQSTRDQRASKDAFEVLDRIVDMRLRRGLLTVVDATHMEARRRDPAVEVARRHGRPLVAVVFDVPVGELLDRNRGREHPVPQRVVRGQASQVADVRAGLVDEGVDHVVDPDDVVVVPPEMLDAPTLATRQREEPLPMRFALSVPRFDFAEPAELGPALAAIARTAEDVGLESMWVMDHLLQIPSMGRAWDPMLEGWTTVSFLAGATSTLRLGLMVGGITLRHPALVGKMVATLDVLSGGRAECGLGAAWYEAEHDAYGIPFPPLAERYELLEDALELLPVLWGPGTKPWRGRRLELAATTCYPRPLQDPHPPILVGGSGERRTLRLVAEHASACNVVGGVEVVRRKVAVLHDHCRVVGRDPADVTVTQLGDVVVRDDRDELAAAVERLRPGDVAPDTWATRVHAGTVEDHVGRFRAMAEAGVDLAVVSLPDLDGPATVERLAPIVEAFR